MARPPTNRQPPRPGSGTVCAVLATLALLTSAAPVTTHAQASLVPCDRSGPGPVFGRDQGSWGEPITASEWIGALPGDTNNGGWEIPRPLLNEIFGPRLIPFGPNAQDDPQRWVVLVNGVLKLRTLVIPQEFQPRPLDTPGLPPMFAAYWNDIDTTFGGDVFICALTDGRTNVVTPGDAIILTWEEVPPTYFLGFGDKGVATFQLVIRVADSACPTDNVTRNVMVEFRYRELEWETVVDFLLRDFISRAGFTDSEGRVVELPGSGDEPAEELLEESNGREPGVYTFMFSRDEAECGDGEVEGCELCDDGNQDNEDDCTNTCEPNVCGDGFVDRQGPELETCDGAEFLNQLSCPEGYEGTPLCNNDPANTTTFDDTCTFTLGGCTEIPRCDDGSLPPCIVDAGMDASIDAGVDASLTESPGAGLDRIRARGGCALGTTSKRSAYGTLAAIGIVLAVRRRRRER